jgi:prepilin-type N-terminal cleavage/methylation domain-containing protein
MSARRQKGFTLVEVMISLGILAMGLAVLIKSTASNIASTEGAQMDGTATALARGEMYELEEKLQKEGFQDMDEHKEGDFSAEGWPSITWSYDIQVVQLPELGAIQTTATKAMEQKQSGSGSGSMAPTGPAPNAMTGNPNDLSGVFGNSTLGGMLSMFGGMGGMGGGMGGSGMTGADKMGAQFIQSQYELVKQVLKASIRRVTLTVKWTVINDPRSMVVIEYVTDPAGMQKVLGSLGADGSTPTSSTTTSTSTSTTTTTKSGTSPISPGGGK